MILISSTFSMNCCKISQNATILKLIDVSKDFQDRFTANYPKFLSSTLIQRKMSYNFTPTFLKIERFEPYAGGTTL